MSKHKTRQEKMITSLQRKLQQQSSAASSSEKHGEYTYTMKHISHTPSAPTTVMTTNLPYVKHDLIKTTIVTASIVILQLVLFFLLKTHIVKIPMISY